MYLIDYIAYGLHLRYKIYFSRKSAENLFPYILAQAAVCIDASTIRSSAGTAADFQASAAASLTEAARKTGAAAADGQGPEKHSDIYSRG